MDKFRIFVYILMRDASLKQRIPCIMRISLFGAFSAGKSAHYTRINTVMLPGIHLMHDYIQSSH